MRGVRRPFIHLLVVVALKTAYFFFWLGRPCPCCLCSLSIRRTDAMTRSSCTRGCSPFAKRWCGWQVTATNRFTLEAFTLLEPPAHPHAPRRKKLRHSSAFHARLRVGFRGRRRRRPCRGLNVSTLLDSLAHWTRDSLETLSYRDST